MTNVCGQFCSKSQSMTLTFCDLDTIWPTMNMPYLAFKQAFRNNQKEQKNIPCQLKNICYLPQQFLISEFLNLSSKNLIFVKYEHNLRIHWTFMQANKFCKEYCYFTLSQWHMNILQSIPPAFYCNIRNMDKDVHLYHTSPLLSCISRCDSTCWDTIPIGQGGGAFVRMLALLIELKYLNLYVQALKKIRGWFSKN